MGSIVLLWAGSVYEAPRGQAKPTSREAATIFESKIRPLLQDKCVSCHGAKQQSGELRLDRPVSLVQAQRIADAITYSGDIKMPPSGILPAPQRAALTVWAKAGAPWPTAAATPVKAKTSFWAFIAPKEPPVPPVKLKWWAKNPLDAFVLAKLESKGLKPAPPADRRTLIRRATFDLTGLPPTPHDIDEFLADSKPGAFERVIDRLLASPAYGERWGRHWLDVARYADSNGVDENLVYPNAWRYRDWVIGAINADKPVDRFIQEQIAGDLLPDAGDDGVVATGYLALGPKMLAEDDPVKQELDIIDEQVDTLSKTYLGLTVGCARCHDHKFDPIPSRDYYALAGIFKSTKTMLNFKNMAEWTERPLGSKVDIEKLTAIESQIHTRTEALRKTREAARTELTKALQPQLPAYEKAARTLLEIERSAVVPSPVIAKPDGLPPVNAIVREAEDFVSGNVLKDTTAFGKGIGVLVNRGELPNSAEYEISVANAGPYQLDLRYASGEPRPIRVFVNGAVALSKAASQSTGGFYPQHQKWFAEGIVLLSAGVNRIKFERESYFPHIDKMLLIARPGAAPTEADQIVARRAGLIPEVVRDVADRIKAGIDLRIELPDEADDLFPTATGKEVKRLTDEIAALQKSKPAVPRAMAVDEGKPTDLKVHLRGNYLTLGDLSPRRFPSVISGPNPPKIPATHSGRLELARWLTDVKNPLTARVFVNRVWRWRFGRGIVASVDNFGTLGELPSHPELLDWLATTFVKQDGWSLKKLHKRLMLTNTYTMSGKYDQSSINADPDDRFLWRFPRQRLEAEAVRDSILFVSGTLDRSMGGASVKLPARSYVTSTANSDTMSYDLPRRSVYLPVIRSALYDVYTAFDFGDPTVMNGDRPSTTVAPQALFMLNGSVVLGATKAQAKDVLKEDVADAERVRRLYISCFGRPATNTEVARAIDYLARFRTAYVRSADPRLNAWQSLCKSLIASNEFIYVE